MLVVLLGKTTLKKKKQKKLKSFLVLRRLFKNKER